MLLPKGNATPATAELAGKQNTADAMLVDATPAAHAKAETTPNRLFFVIMLAYFLFFVVVVSTPSRLEPARESSERIVVRGRPLSLRLRVSVLRPA
jgi:hypothetical protein